MNRPDPDFFPQNLALLQQHHPEIPPEVLAGIGGGMPTIPPGSPLMSGDEFTNIDVVQPLFKIPDFVHDPQQFDCEFAALLGQLGEDQEALLFLVGLGSGYEAQLFLEKFPLLRLIILEPSIPLFQEALKGRDLSFLLANPNLSLHMGNAIDIQKILAQEDDALRTLPLHLVTHKGLLELFADVYGPLQRKLATELLHFQGRLSTIENQGPLFFANTIKNAGMLGETADMAGLRNIARGLPAVCVASGPSLTKNLMQLKGKEQSLFIIAVDSAVKVLLDHGIQPHLIVTIDPIPASLTKLRSFIDAGHSLPVVWTPEAYPPTIANLKGKQKFVLPGVNDLFRLYFSPLTGHGSTFPHMLSVIHTATHVAMVAGCNQVIYIGLDLAVYGDKDHAEGCPVKWTRLATHHRFTIPAWDGGEVETISVLRNQLLSLESIIRQNRNVEFIDATEGGALISGTKVMPLREALAACANQNLDIHARLSVAFEQGARPEPTAVVEALLRLQGDIRTSQKLALNGSKQGQEAIRLWKLTKIPDLRAKSLQEFQKVLVGSGESYDRLRAMDDLTNALYPLRAREHHRFIYRREKFRQTATAKTPEQRIFVELDMNLAYFKSWIATAETALAIIEPELKKLTGLRTEEKG